MSSFELAERLEALVPPELSRGDWTDVTRRVAPRRRPVLKAAIAFALFAALAAAATAMYLVLRGDHAKPTPGALTVITGGGKFNSAAIVEVRPGGRLVPVWRCPTGEQCAELTSLAWAPDGRHLAFSLDSFACGCSGDGLHILDLRTGHDFHVFPTAAGRVGCRRPGNRWSSFDVGAWSPDSRTLAFSCPTGLHTIRSDGTDARRISAGGGWATWSPDGRRLAFSWSSARAKHSSIFVMRLAGLRRTRIVADGDAPSWSPDGRRIAYRAPDGIRFVTPSGIDVTPAGGSLKPRGLPAWSPNGTRIAVGTRRGVFVIPGRGGRGRLVTTAGVSAGFGETRPAWYPGRHASRQTQCGEC